MNNDDLNDFLVSMPLLVGMEGENAVLVAGVNLDPEISTELVPEGVSSQPEARHNRCKTIVEPAETGRPETSREFAARTASHFALHGPQEREEGKSPTVTSMASQPDQQSTTKLTIHLPARRKVAPAAGETQAMSNDGSAGINKEPYLSEKALSGIEQALEAQLTERAREIAETIEPLLAVTLEELLAGGQEPIDLLHCIRDQYTSDSVFAKIDENPCHYKNFELTSDGLMYLRNTDGHRVLCIPTIKAGTHSVREIVISEAHSLLAHLGPQKTLTYLRELVWWKDMNNDVHSFCNSCVICRQSKPTNQKPYGLLNPLPIPAQLWESIGIDFVGPLPLSKNRDAAFDSIMVVIDLLTTMVHLIPSRTTYIAQEVAELVFEQIYKHHGVPRAIISDRDSLFTSLLWSHLHKAIRSQLKISSAYHPEMDGATERANRTIVQMLRQCIGENQRDWVAKLPAIEFAINYARSESMGYAPLIRPSSGCA